MSQSKTPLRDYGLTLDEIIARKAWLPSRRSTHYGTVHQWLWQARDYAKWLGFTTPTYPEDAHVEATWYVPVHTTATLRVVLLPSRPTKGRSRGTGGHRVFIECPCCLSDIPAGKIGQHYRAHIRNAIRESEAGGNA